MTDGSSVLKLVSGQKELRKDLNIRRETCGGIFFYMNKNLINLIVVEILEM